ncbi:MAG: DUF3817 domain-containing protein [Burkholderiaceae bacterium]|nr:DUF3817 domain-containing protein [Microbacteriaceae bacterium]
MRAALQRIKAAIGRVLCRTVRWTAIAAAIGWVGFAIGAIATSATDNNVPLAILGRLFAFAIVTYLIATFAAAFWFRWHGGLFALCVLSAAVPLTSLLMLRWLSRNGRLDLGRGTAVPV